jgi:hypothetical protein
MDKLAEYLSRGRVAKLDGHRRRGGRSRQVKISAIPETQLFPHTSLRVKSLHRRHCAPRSLALYRIRQVLAAGGDKPSDEISGSECT